MMATETTALPATTKLKIKFSCCKTVMSYDFGKGLWSVVDQSSSHLSGKKRAPPEIIEAPRAKKPKTTTDKCSTILVDKTVKNFNARKCGNNSEWSLEKEQIHGLSGANVAEGEVRVLDEENVCPNYGEAGVPQKALRGAMLKSRFSDIILKSRVILGQVNASDQLKMQQERARLEHKQCEDKARIEAELRAAQAAVQRQRELKEQKERQREEARIALDKMERTVEFDQNCYLVELKKLSGYYGGSWGPHFRSPLERLGLFFKGGKYTEEYDELEEGEILELEEGEILG